MGGGGGSVCVEGGARDTFEKLRVSFVVGGARTREREGRRVGFLCVLGGETLEGFRTAFVGGGAEEPLCTRIGVSIAFNCECKNICMCIECTYTCAWMCRYVY